MSSQEDTRSSVVDLTQDESNPPANDGAPMVIADDDSDIEEVVMEAPNDLEAARQRALEQRRERLLAQGIDETIQQARVREQRQPDVHEVIVISDTEEANQEQDVPDDVEVDGDRFAQLRRRRRDRRIQQDMQYERRHDAAVRAMTPMRLPLYEGLRLARPNAGWGAAPVRPGSPLNMHRRSILLDNQRLLDRHQRHLEELIAEQEAEYPGLFEGLVDVMGRIGNALNPFAGWGATALGWAEALNERVGGPQPPEVERPLDLPDAPEYQVSFSHPGKMAPGFTSDFAPVEPDTITLEDSNDEDEYDPLFDDLDSEAAKRRRAKWRKRKGKGKAALVTEVEKPTLVVCCSRCKDPLVIGGDEAHRIYGLRCGHVLDDKCLWAIGSPPPLIAGDAHDKGKGKSTDNTDNSFTFTVPLPPRPTLSRQVPTNRQDANTFAEPMQPGVYEEDNDPEPAVIPESIRSRLRSRREIVPTPNLHRRRGHRTMDDVDDYLDDDAPEGPLLDIGDPFFPRLNQPTITPTPLRKKNSKGKRKQSRKRPVDSLGSHGLPTRKVPKTRGKLKEELFEWGCPVDGCGMKHLSVRLDLEGAKWKQDEDSGARLMFL